MNQIQNEKFVISGLRDLQIIVEKNYFKMYFKPL